MATLEPTPMSKLKLYFAPGACSLAPHIALREAGLDHDLEKVDLRTHLTSHEVDFRTINPKGYVPALVLEDGQLLTEVAVILLYIADRVPERHLAPPATSFERYRLYERLNYLATEVHKNFSPLFSPATSDEMRTFIKERLLSRLELLNEALATQTYLGGAQFDVSDAYLITLLTWARWTQVELSTLPALEAYRDRMLAHPSVQDAIATEKVLRTRATPRVDPPVSL
jgi:glutathione S-transferase